MTEEQQENNKNNSNSKEESQTSPQKNSAVDDILSQKHQKEMQDLNNKLLRVIAESENLRKRKEQQITELKKYAIADFAKEFIVVLENFHLILDNAPFDTIEKDEKLSNFYKGIEITKNDLTKVFEKNGIVRIYPLEQKFDHNLHQVINQVESDKEPGTVVQVLQAGYTLNDRLLKEAMVVISK